MQNNLFAGNALNHSVSECTVYHERNVREEQHPYICGANKQSY